MTVTVPTAKGDASLLSLIWKLFIFSLLGGAGLVAWLFFFNAKPTQDDVVFLPEQTNALIRVDIRRFVASSFVPQLRPMFEEQISGNLPDNDLSVELLHELTQKIDTVTLGLRVDPGRPEQSDVAGVIRFRSEQLLDNLIPGKLASKALYEELDDGQHIVTIHGSAMCQVDAHTVAVGRPSTLREVLRRNKTASLAPKLQETLDATSLTKVLTVIVATPMVTVDEAAAPPAWRCRTSRH